MHHLHVGLFEFLVWSAYAVLFNFLVRQLAAKLADRPIGEAIAYVAV